MPRSAGLPEAVCVVRAFAASPTTGATRSEGLTGIFEDCTGAGSLVETFSQLTFERRRKPHREALCRPERGCRGAGRPRHPRSLSENPPDRGTLLGMDFVG